jgi:hypothetical protein
MIWVFGTNWIWNFGIETCWLAVGNENRTFHEKIYQQHSLYIIEEKCPALWFCYCTQKCICWEIYDAPGISYLFIWSVDRALNKSFHCDEWISPVTFSYQELKILPYMANIFQHVFFSATLLLLVEARGSFHQRMSMHKYNKFLIE